MRDAKGKHISADPAKPGPWSATGENHPSEPGEPELRYTPEQQELLEQGLRILARLACARLPPAGSVAAYHRPRRATARQSC